MLKVFEAFAGCGSQSIALERIGVEHEVVATSEIDPDAILAYSATRGNIENKMELPSKMIKYLEDRNIGKDFKRGTSIIKKLSMNKLRVLYNASLVAKNLGDISIIEPNNIPDHDLFTYSFPCQSLSQAGLREGLAEGSGTKSSLIWECRKVISAKKPKYLLLENVAALLSNTYKYDFNLWCQWLEEQGYQNYYKILGADDYGIPQSRERVFMVSILGESDYYMFPRGMEGGKTLYDILDIVENTKYKLSPSEEKALEDTLIDVEIGVGSNPTSREYAGFKSVAPTLCARDYKGPKVCTYMLNGTRVTRRVSPLEYWRLMGFTDEQYNRCRSAGVSESAMYKIAGNSIVVPVLEAIFKELFK